MSEASDVTPPQTDLETNEASMIPCYKIHSCVFKKCSLSQMGVYIYSTDAQIDQVTRRLRHSRGYIGVVLPISHHHDVR